MRKNNSLNIIWHKTEVTREMREKLNKHKSLAIWFTGLPSSGKSTIAHKVEKRLYELGIRTYTLDGDNIRHGLNSDLGFTKEDRKENLRRVAEVIKLFIDAGIVVLAAFISPYKEDRKMIKKIIGPEDFVEIYCKCPAEICAQRDPKQLYKKAKNGLIKGYTGVDAPYEEPDNPDLVLETHLISIDEAVNKVKDFILPKILEIK